MDNAGFGSPGSHPPLALEELQMLHDGEGDGVVGGRRAKQLASKRFGASEPQLGHLRPTPESPLLMKRVVLGSAAQASLGRVQKGAGWWLAAPHVSTVPVCALATLPGFQREALSKVLTGCHARLGPGVLAQLLTC